MDTDSPAPLIHLGDPGRCQVEIQDPDHARRHTMSSEKPGGSEPRCAPFPSAGSAAPGRRPAARARSPADHSWRRCRGRPATPRPVTVPHSNSAGVEIEILWPRASRRDRSANRSGVLASGTGEGRPESPGSWQ
jgi:hypothetical protein